MHARKRKHSRSSTVTWVIFARGKTLSFSMVAVPNYMRTVAFQLLYYYHYIQLWYDHINLLHQIFGIHYLIIFHQFQLFLLSEEVWNITTTQKYHAAQLTRSSWAPTIFCCRYIGMDSWWWKHNLHTSIVVSGCMTVHVLHQLGWWKDLVFLILSRQKFTLRNDKSPHIGAPHESPHVATIDVVVVKVCVLVIVVVVIIVIYFVVVFVVVVSVVIPSS